MDEYRENVEKIQKALNQDAAFIQTNPYLVQQVLYAAKVKKASCVSVSGSKKPVLLLLLAVLILAFSVTAVAAALLSAQQIIDEYAIPMAHEYESKEYTIEDTNRLLRLAEDNNVHISNEGKAAIERYLVAGTGYSKGEFLMELAKAEFGEHPDAWTIEQQKWFDDACLAIEYISAPNKALPNENVLTETAALDIAKQYIIDHYSKYSSLHDINNSDYYRIGVQFNVDVDCMFTGTNYWTVIFSAVGLMEPSYYIYMTPEGEVLTCEVKLGVYEGAMYSEILNRYKALYGWDMFNWPQDILQSFREAISFCKNSNGQEYMSFMKVSFPDYTEEMISKQEAVRCGVEALHLMDYSIESAILVSSEHATVWRICYLVSNSRTDYHYYYADINALTGQIEYCGEQVERDFVYRRLIPQSVLDEMKTVLDIETKEPVG